MQVEVLEALGPLCSAPAPSCLTQQCCLEPTACAWTHQTVVSPRNAPSLVGAADHPGRGPALQQYCRSRSRPVAPRALHAAGAVFKQSVPSAASGVHPKVPLPIQPNLHPPHLLPHSVAGMKSRTLQVPAACSCPLMAAQSPAPATDHQQPRPPTFDNKTQESPCGGTASTPPLALRRGGSAALLVISSTLPVCG